MRRTRGSAGIAAHVANADSFISSSVFGPRKTKASSARPCGVEQLWPVGGRIKRSFDVALALFALVLLAPIILLVAILLRVGIGRPLLFAEDYVGFGGRVFTAYTFRTARILHATKLTSAPTIATCLGTLHDARLDRLPQLVSILRGEMSFVGPQAIRLGKLDRSEHLAPDYLKVRPGLVGLRPAGRTRIASCLRRRALVRYYVRHWSIWLDLTLLANAVAAARDDKETN
jgi:lipopolysaccharide/colanic/teichoic acid biosynthesis glycosyltransferase